MQTSCSDGHGRWGSRFRGALREPYEWIGRPDEATQIAREILAVNPAMTAEAAANQGVAARDPSEIPALIVKLRRAGLP